MQTRRVIDWLSSRRGALLWMTAAAVLVAVVALATWSTLHPEQTATISADAIPARPGYNWDVRPILSQNCFACHGKQTQKAGLRLDEEQAAYGRVPEDPDNRAIVPGHPEKSELIRRITSSDPDERMPAQLSHKVLSQREISLLTRWVEQGAQYQQHWAYQSPRKVRPAASPWDDRAVNPIDNYVYARLATEALQPAPEADRETLINRVTLDLTGLPPTLQQVDDFISDHAPKAYERVVDRLLNSRQYAERQANVWLDVARYADSDGFLFDNIGRFQHPYRDWLISAFQRNMPYDQFVTWQLAGDKLPNASREQILATYFLRAGKRSNEGGITDEEYRVEYGLERTELIGKAFLGLTVGCAKCHDHKYDVISQKDFYSMYAFFDQADERGIAQAQGYTTPQGPTLAFPSPLQSAGLATAHGITMAKERAYRAALQSVRQAVTPQAAAVVRSSPAERAAFIKSRSDADLLAYYPLDSSYQGPNEALIQRGGPDGVPLILADAIDAERRASASGPPASIYSDLPRVAMDDVARTVRDAASRAKVGSKPPVKPPGLPKQFTNLSKLAWTPSGIPGGKPAALYNVHPISGIKGNGVLLRDSIGMAYPGIGFFERTDPFTIDAWIRLRTDKPYGEVNILYNQWVESGYSLDLHDNFLRFAVVHQAPVNQLAVISLTEMPKGKWIHVTATYDGSSMAAGAKLYLDGKALETEVEHDQLTRSSRPTWGAALEYSAYGFAMGAQFRRDEFKDGGIDEVKLYNRNLTPLEVAVNHDPAVAAAPTRDAGEQIADMIAARDPRVVAARAELTAAVLAEQQVESSIYQLMVMGDVRIPRRTYVRDRGVFNVLKLDEPVQPEGLNRVFAWNTRFPRNRLGLAQWLFDHKNPMTSRVFVNRLWQGHFGNGIVDTLDDFGSQGSNPSHPELLDWLALEFVRSGWDIRHMHKLVVMSATYRQSSDLIGPSVSRDPRNFLLARGPRYRMPGEMIRDNALFASGLLVDQPGGDSVFPYQPAGVWFTIGFPQPPYPANVPDDQNHRRSMYTFIRRNAAFPSLTVFDMPDRNNSAVGRRISNTPLQSLVLLNDTQYVEAYRKLAERALKIAPSSDEQLVMVFRLATRRRPMPAELQAMRDYRSGQIAAFTKAPADVDKLLKTGTAAVDPTIDRVQLTALTMVTAGVMNSPDAYSLR